VVWEKPVSAAIERIDQCVASAGDRVLFGKWSGTEVTIDGQELLIMKESDIMGVLTETSAKKKAA
jgi:co-chaperonin GroES (HSP10)